MSSFHDRLDAAEQLAKLLGPVESQTVVLGLPRGGVMVANRLARMLGLKVDAYVVRKLRAPGIAEMALGAVSEDGVSWMDPDITARLDIDPEYVRKECRIQQIEVDRQIHRFRAGRELPLMSGKDIVVVDDGIATGSTAMAGVLGIRTRNPRSVTVAAPVAATRAVETLSRAADRVVVVESPPNFWAVGESYEVFEQVSDEEVLRALGKP